MPHNYIQGINFDLQDLPHGLSSPAACTSVFAFQKVTNKLILKIKSHKVNNIMIKISQGVKRFRNIIIAIRAHFSEDLEGVIEDTWRSDSYIVCTIGEEREDLKQEAEKKNYNNDVDIILFILKIIHRWLVNLLSASHKVLLLSSAAYPLVVTTTLYLISSCHTTPYFSSVQFLALMLVLI